MIKTLLNNEKAFPHQVQIEGIPVDAFENIQCFFHRLLAESNTPKQSLVYYLNVHVANTAYRNIHLKSALKQGDVVYCDGAGIVKASQIQHTPLPTRMTAADWVLDLIAFMAEHQKTLYFLGGEPGIPEKALVEITRQIPHHTIIGTHHGYILNNPSLAQQVMADINQLQPDILIVGFGTPLQELWIQEHAKQLDVPVVYAIGAVLDYVAGKVPRCPAWMGNNGLEWLFRFYTEPRRLFNRYIVGNPWFLSRIFLNAMLQRVGLQKQ